MILMKTTRDIQSVDQERALLVQAIVGRTSREEAADSLAELERLADTAGATAGTPSFAGAAAGAAGTLSRIASSLAVTSFNRYSTTCTFQFGASLRMPRKISAALVYFWKAVPQSEFCSAACASCKKMNALAYGWPGSTAGEHPHAVRGR